MKKPIKVFYSELGECFYATSHYRIKGNVAIITGEKTDVTNDIAAAVIKHEITFTKKESENNGNNQ